MMGRKIKCAIIVVVFLAGVGAYRIIMWMVAHTPWLFSLCLGLAVVCALRELARKPGPDDEALSRQDEMWRQKLRKLI